MVKSDEFYDTSFIISARRKNVLLFITYSVIIIIQFISNFFVFKSKTFVYTINYTTQSTFNNKLCKYLLSIVVILINTHPLRTTKIVLSWGIYKYTPNPIQFVTIEVMRLSSFALRRVITPIKNSTDTLHDDNMLGNPLLIEFETKIHFTRHCQKHSHPL